MNRLQPQRAPMTIQEFRSYDLSDLGDVRKYTARMNQRRQQLRSVEWVLAVIDGALLTWFVLTVAAAFAR